MTYDEFLEKLRATPRTWVIGFQNRPKIIRNTDPILVEKYKGCTCPGVVVGIFKTGNDTIDRSGMCWKIAEAADGFGEPKIRKDLLDACGLVE